MKIYLPELPIQIDFHLQKNSLERTNLSFSDDPSFFKWNLLGNCTNPKLKDHIHTWIQSYVHKKPFRKPLPLTFPDLPAFTLRVLQNLKKIPFGKTLSYKELSFQSASPSAFRACGAACGRNPFPLILPCHRVISSNRKLSGFNCGIAIKKQLLQFEEIRI